MFGNPNISATPVDDSYGMSGNILRSQADLYNNNFTNPISYGTTNPGWGMDPSLMTPSYTAGYRPSYTGSSGATTYGRPGMWESIKKVSPTSDDLAWGNPIDHGQPYVDSLSSKPTDAAMWTAQRIAAPVAAMWGANYLLGGAYKGPGAFRKMMGSVGMTQYGYNMGSKFGGGLGRGIAQSFGLGKTATSVMGKFAGGAGGVAVGFGATLALYQGAMYGAEKYAFDPYMENRRNADNLRANFSGVTFGDAKGHSVSGQGLGGYESSVMGSTITQQAIKDMTFSNGEYGQGADMLARAGLMDNVGAKGITDRVKQGIEQTKLIMSIANMPEMKDAIEQLAKFQKMGASVIGGGVSTASKTMTELGQMATVAGTSVQRLMETVGAQGQYLYQANGMTPYLGQLAAANTHAALSTGNRMGLISESQLARMGGLDGATQAAMTGEINASQTMYNKMANYNRYMGGGRQNNMIGNITSFGQNMAKDPMQAMGSMTLYGRMMAGRQSQERGSLAVEDQLMDIARTMPWLLDKNGKISIEKAAPILTTMGMSEESIHAWAAKRISETDEGAYNLTKKGLNVEYEKQQRQFISQNGLYGGPVGGTIRKVKVAGRESVANFAKTYVDPISNSVGKASDSLSQLKDNLWFGATISDDTKPDLAVNEYLGVKKENKPKDKYLGFDDPDNMTGEMLAASLNYFKGPFGSIKATSEFASRMSDPSKKVAKKLNELSQADDKNAEIYFNKKSTPEEKSKALLGALGSKTMGDLGTDYLKDFDKLTELEKQLNKQDIKELTAEKKKKNALSGSFFSSDRDDYKKFFSFFSSDDYKPESDTGDLRSKLTKVSGLKDKEDLTSFQTIGHAVNIATKVKQGEINPKDLDKLMKTDSDLIEFGKATGKKGKDLIKHAQDMTVGAKKEGFIPSGLMSLNLDRSIYKTDLDAVKDLNARVPLRKGAVKNADEWGVDKVVESTIAEQQLTSKLKDITQKYQSGRVDFSGYQSTVNALNNGKSVDKFEKSVKDFEDAVNTLKENSKPSNGLSLKSIFSSSKPDNVKESANASGNSK